jgi:uncharacterized protein YhfF
MSPMKKIGLFLPPAEIERVKRAKTTFCQPKNRTEAATPGHVQEILHSIGQVFDVADESGKVRAEARLKDAFLTTYGQPDSRLLEGYGFAGDAKKFQEKYREFWKRQFPQTTLENDTELFVVVYEPA